MTAHELTEIQQQIDCDKVDETLPEWWTNYHSGALNMAIASTVKHAIKLVGELERDASKAGSATGTTEDLDAFANQSERSNTGEVQA